MMGSAEKTDSTEAVRLEIIDSPGQPAAGCEETRSAALQAWDAVLWELIAAVVELQTAEKERKGATYADRK